MSTIGNESPKDHMIAILREQPDDSSYDELLRELALRRAVLRGLSDVDEGRTLANEEALQRIRSWRN